MNVRIISLVLLIGVIGRVNGMEDMEDDAYNLKYVDIKNLNTEIELYGQTRTIKNWCHLSSNVPYVDIFNNNFPCLTQFSLTSVIEYNDTNSPLRFINNLNDMNNKSLLDVINTGNAIYVYCPLKIISNKKTSESQKKSLLFSAIIIGTNGYNSKEIIKQVSIEFQKSIETQLDEN